MVEKEGPLPEAKAAILMAVLINVLDYIHQVGILHRDGEFGPSRKDKRYFAHSHHFAPVRPPNILFLNKERDPSTSIVIDFGLAIKLPPNGKPVTERNIGAPFYTAPEISDINSPGYGPAADMYSAGCVAYFLLTGRRPPGENSPVYGTLSAEAIDFVEGLRNKDQFARLNARQALDHPWIRRHVDAETLDYLRGVNEEVLAGKTIGPRTATFIKPPEEGKKEGKTGFKAKVKAFFSKVFRRKNGQ